MKIGIVLMLMLHYGCVVYESPVGSSTPVTPTTATSMEELQVPPNFSWKPTEPRDMKLEIVTIHGAEFPRTGIVSVYDSDNNLISRGKSGERGEYRTRLTLPSQDVIVEVSCGSITRREEIHANQLGLVQIKM